MKSPWYDPDRHGRLLNAIIKSANTEYYKALEAKNIDMASAWFDRIIKSENAIRPYIEIVTGVKKLIREGQKLEADITN